MERRFAAWGSLALAGVALAASGGCRSPDRVEEDGEGVLESPALSFGGAAKPEARPVEPDADVEGEDER